MAATIFDGFAVAIVGVEADCESLFVELLLFNCWDVDTVRVIGLLQEGCALLSRGWLFGRPESSNLGRLLDGSVIFMTGA